MTTKFEVGDDIWWLDTRKLRIKDSIILEIEDKDCSSIGYIVKDTCVWSGSTVVAKTKEELIDLLYPPKIGLFDYNQLVYLIRDIGDGDNKCLHITKAYVKGSTVFTSEYNFSCAKDGGPHTFFTANIKDIYSTVDLAKETIERWLNNNDN